MMAGLADWNRSVSIAGLLLVLFGAALVAPAAAQGRLQGEVTGGNLKPIPIAIPEFQGDDPRFALEVSNIVAADLERSGLFQPLDRAGFIDTVTVRDMNAPPRFPDWRAINAQALVVGRAYKGPDGRLVAEARVWDVFSTRQLGSQRFTVAADDWRRLGHLVADLAYEKLTGEKGYFDTQVVFVDETGPKDKRNKRLAIMDQDGANIRLLSQGKELVLTPRFSPTQHEITFMQYTGDQPRVFLLNIETGQRELVGNFPNMTFAPRFSPDGQRIVMSVSEGGNSAIVEMDLRSKQMRRLTQGSAIDTAPCFSPDGRRIVFESDRDGTPAALRDGHRRLPAAPHQLRGGPLLDAGLVAARRPDRLHQADGRPVPDRRDAPGRLRRAHPDRGLPQRGPHLVAQRPGDHVLPREPGRQWRPQALLRRPDRPQRAAGADAVLCLRSGLVTVAQLKHNFTAH